MISYQTARTSSRQNHTEAIIWQGPGFYIYSLKTLQWERPATLEQVEEAAAQGRGWAKYFSQNDVEEMVVSNGR